MGYVCKLCQTNFDNEVEACTKCGGAVQQAADVKKANVSGIIALICAFIFVGLNVFLVLREIQGRIRPFYLLCIFFQNSTWFWAAISLYKHKKSLFGLIAFLITVLTNGVVNIIYYFLHI